MTAQAGVVEVPVRDGLGRPGVVQLRAEDGEVVLAAPASGGCRLTLREVDVVVRVLGIVGATAQAQRRGLPVPAVAHVDGGGQLDWAAGAHRRLCAVADLVGTYNVRAQVTGNTELAALVRQLREVIQPGTAVAERRGRKRTAQRAACR